MKKAELMVITKTDVKKALNPAPAMIRPATNGISVGKIFPAPEIPAYIARFVELEISSKIPLEETTNKLPYIPPRKKAT